MVYRTGKQKKRNINILFMNSTKVCS